MRTALLLLLAGALTAPLRADEAADYHALLAAYKASEYATALERARAFATAYPASTRQPDALFLSGRCAHKLKRYDEAEAPLSAFLERFPDHPQADAARSQLLDVLDGARQLDRVVEQAGRFLASRPTASRADHWRYSQGEALFRLWRFTEAEQALLALTTHHPSSSYVVHADRLLAWIDPRLDLGPDGVVAYRGKYVADARLLALRARLPELLAQARRTLHAALGIDPGAERLAVIEFVDGGTTRISDGLTRTYGERGQPATIMSFATETMVTSPEEFGPRLTHELKHALFRRRIGQRYLALPRWVREGLAVHAAGQASDRIAHEICSIVFSGREPLAVITGLESEGDEERAYFEDVMAFEWLAQGDRTRVHRFAAALLSGADHRRALETAAGKPYEACLRDMEVHARNFVGDLLGLGLARLAPLDREERALDSDARRTAWLNAGGEARYRSWLAEHPGHVLAPLARLRLGRHLVVARRHAEGRALLRQILEGDLPRCPFGDDALYWIGRSHELAGELGDAKAAYGALLRDYSSRKVVQKLAKSYAPAGPLTALPAPGGPIR